MLYIHTYDLKSVRSATVFLSDDDDDDDELLGGNIRSRERGESERLCFDCCSGGTGQRKKERGLIAFLDGHEDKAMHDGSMSGQRTISAWHIHTTLSFSPLILFIPTQNPPIQPLNPPKKQHGLHPIPSPQHSYSQQQILPPRPQVPTSAPRAPNPRLRNLHPCQPELRAEMRRRMHGDAAEQDEV